jgi:hypothetical protein
MARDYKKEAKYHAQPEQVANRVKRNQARAAMEKKLGRKLPSNVDVDHKRPLSAGGSNSDSNTRVVSESKNSAWRKGSKGYKVKSV